MIPSEIPACRKLAEANEVRPTGFGLNHCIQHFGQILAEITNMVVQLSERDTHNFLEINEKCSTKLKS
jgi:hypothetical protein